MTKEQFIKRWKPSHMLIADIDALIAHEVAKVKEAKPQELKGNCSTFDMSKLVDQPQPDFNPIAEAYERGEKIRFKKWSKNEWIKKHSKTDVINEIGNILQNTFEFYIYPNAWEIYTELEQVTDQVTYQVADQVQNAKPFDKDRFERMFCAVVASGVKLDFEFCKRETTYFIQQLDAYNASKEGGNNE